MENTNDKVVIIVSAPRSGSTWVARILRSHPDLDVYTHNTDDNHLLYAISPFQSLNPFGDDYIGSNNVYDNFLLSIKSRYVKRVFKTRDQSKTLTISTPTTATFLPALIKAFPNGKFIHLWRSSFDQVLSFRNFVDASRTKSFRTNFNNYKHHGNLRALRNGLAHCFHRWRWLSFKDGGFLGTRPRGFSAKKRLPTLQFLTWYYAQYNKEIKEALKSIPQNRKYELVFDNLVSDFRDEFTKLMDFFEIPAPPELVEELAAKVHKDAVGKYRSNFTQAEIDNISDWLKEYE
ncbi:MAG: sulfotransferase [Acidobacteriota bacterium]